MKLDAAVARACQRVPGMVSGALVLLPDALLLAGVGGNALDLEPLIRAVDRCFANRIDPFDRMLGQPFVEYLFVIDGQLVVIQGGRRDVRLALVIVSTREHNLGFAFTAARLAMIDIEANVDLAAWGL